MTTEEKFNAAVNVIRSLPKNGSYQPSNELMLRFYAYYKQATQGPCSGQRPGFWDLVGRAKYDAWKRLGDTTRNEAMKKYVDELHSIVETMSYSDKVANFLEAPTNELDGINLDDLELIAGDVLEKVRSQPNSPLASREGSPIRFISSLSSSRSASPNIPVDDSDHSDDEYIDTIELPNHLVDNEQIQNTQTQDELSKTLSNGVPTQHDNTRDSPTNDTSTVHAQVQHVSRSRVRSQNHTVVDISQEIAKTIDSLKVDLQRLTNQVDALETANKMALSRRKGLFGGLQPQLVAFIIVWPFLASFIVNRWVSRRK